MLGGGDGGKKFVAIRFEEVEDDPGWGCETVDHALPYGSELLLSTRSFDEVDLELDKVCDGMDHLRDNSVAVYHLEKVGEVGERARLRVKRPEIEASVAAYR